MRRIILGTAGHIDHGKTALVKALTGIDTDRLAEEKERGISIDLGFAHFDLAGGSKVGVVDVPGHERFIKNMLAGVGGMDVVLFVVACDEGIMPQTREHFDIVSLLGIRRAVFALTKCDVVDQDLVGVVRQEVEDFLRPTVFRGSPIVATSVKTGEGLDEIRRVLETVVGDIQERAVGEAVRLPIDRVFTIAGRGTVVTGTLWSGTVSPEDRLEIEPGGHPVRVRTVEVHGDPVAAAYAGQRTALGIHGVDKADLARGYCVVSPGDFRATEAADLEMFLLASADRPLENRARVRFHLGSSETIGRLTLLGRQKLQPGEKCFAQIRLENPVVAAYGDRFVVRTYSPMNTIGGGRVLDPLAGWHKRRDPQVAERLAVLADGDLERAVEEYARQSGVGIRLDDLGARVNCGRVALEKLAAGLVARGRLLEAPSGVYVHADLLRRLDATIRQKLKAYQAQNRLTWGMPKEEMRERLGSIDMAFLSWVLARLETDGGVFTKKGLVRAGSADVEMTPSEEGASRLVVAALKGNIFQPPSESQLETQAGIPTQAFRKVLSLLVEAGEVVRLEPGLVVHVSAVETAAERIRAYLKAHGEATASDLKTVLGTTRKYAVPLLELLDKTGVTRRRGDKRTLVG